MVNKVILIGNLGKDPQTKTTANGTVVCNFSLATTEKYTDKSGEKQNKTQWHNITCFGKTAELAARFLCKGSKTYIEGKITYNVYDDKDGNQKVRTDIVAQNLTFLTFKPKYGSRPTNDDSFNQDAPRQQSVPQHSDNPLIQDTMNADDNSDLPF